MASPRPITIIGGGLAGLTLGIALRQAGIPIRLIEAGNYPRHKVCGEFISGLHPSALNSLWLDDLFADAPRHRAVSWIHGERAFRRDELPQPAIGLSRYALDQRLATRFAELGGELRTGARFGSPDPAEGLVWAGGRQPAKTRWLGLKAHFSNLKLDADLEMRLGRYAYVGASAVEGDRVNVCGLFRRSESFPTSRQSALIDYLRHANLSAFADKLQQATLHQASACSIAAIRFASRVQSDHAIRLGDAYAVMPPFTGNGMSLAIESALAAAPHLVEYASGQSPWGATVEHTNQALATRFSRRLSVSGSLHTWLYHPLGQTAYRLLGATRLLPFQALFRLTR